MAASDGNHVWPPRASDLRIQELTGAGPEASTPDHVFAVLRAAGYIGSIDDMWHQHLVALGITDTSEPFTDSISTGTPLPAIAGLSLHLDSTITDSITEDVNGVSLWADQSGNGNDVGQTDNLQKPITATIGGINVITFDRAAEVLELAAGSVTGMEGPEITVFTVVNKRYAGEGGIYPGVIARQAGNWAAGWRMAPDNANVNMDFAVSGYTREAKVVDFTIADTGAATFDIYTGDHVSSTDTTRGFHNNSLTQTNTDAGVDLAASSYNIDVGNGSPDHSRGFFGSIAEILVYETKLSDVNRTAVYDYLAAKYPQE